jgi:predicted alpha/beta-hydrolase family hydrolase
MEKRMPFIFDGEELGMPTILLSHGAGAPMDSGFMQQIAAELAARKCRVARFEFAYMAERRNGGKRRPPPKIETLMDEYRASIEELGQVEKLVIGGKSMGSRVASMIADELWDKGLVAGLLCLGYPFHPPGAPERLRTSHLAENRTPTLICQGTRDKLGSRGEVEGYALSDKIELFWLEDGDHDLKPRKRVSGETQEAHLRRVAERAAAWVRGLE